MTRPVCLQTMTHHSLRLPSICKIEIPSYLEAFHLISFIVMTHWRIKVSPTKKETTMVFKRILRLCYNSTFKNSKRFFKKWEVFINRINRIDSKQKIWENIQHKVSIITWFFCLSSAWSVHVSVCVCMCTHWSTCKIQFLLWVTAQKVWKRL